MNLYAGIVDTPVACAEKEKAKTNSQLRCGTTDMKDRFSATNVATRNAQLQTAHGVRFAAMSNAEDENVLKR